jgi:2,4-dienoyl-CoA reductase-like NADH-dependent reductase (Old Yellow Enzyme family)
LSPDADFISGPTLKVDGGGDLQRTIGKDKFMTDLFDGFDLKGLPLSNRVVMSATTRTLATEDDVPTDVMRDYYVQRGSAELIVTECAQVSDQGHHPRSRRPPGRPDRRMARNNRCTLTLLP